MNQFDLFSVLRVKCDSMFDRWGPLGVHSTMTVSQYKSSREIKEGVQHRAAGTASTDVHYSLLCFPQSAFFSSSYAHSHADTSEYFHYRHKATLCSHEALHPQDGSGPRGDKGYDYSFVSEI